MEKAKELLFFFLIHIFSARETGAMDDEKKVIPALGLM